MPPALGPALTLLGLVTGVAVFWAESRRRGLWTSGVQVVAAWGLLGGAVAARLTEAAVARAPWWQLLDLSGGGKAIFGGVLGGWAAVELAKWRLGLRRSTGDLFALALPAGEAVGRLGCHFSGCCYGKATSGWFAVVQHGAARYPTQLVSAVVAAGLFGLLFGLRDRVAEGRLFRLYLLLWSVARFGIEFLREGPTALVGLTLMQWVCVEVVVGLAVWEGAGRWRRGRG